MPELPEVETIKNQLSTKLPLYIKKVSYSPVVSSILKDKDKNFSPKGKTLVEIRRNGKMLDFVLDDKFHILSHLGMSGSWRMGSEKITVKHTHIQLEGTSEDGSPLFFAYVDPRRFGNMYFYKEEKALEYQSKLGMDISSEDFTAQYIYEVLKKYPNRQLKPFLLDQKYFAGCGNYIACEICARAGIRPTRRSGKITKGESKRIKDATVSVLEGQIQRNGLTFSGGYSDAFGDKGEGVRDLVVFHQKTCGLCGKEDVKKIVLAQRGTYYCPHCQK